MKFYHTLLFFSVCEKYRKKMKKKREEKEVSVTDLQVESMAGKHSPDSPEEGYVSSTTEKDSVKSRPVTPRKKTTDEVKLPPVEQKTSSSPPKSNSKQKSKKEVTILPAVKTTAPPEEDDAFIEVMTDAEHEKSLEQTLKDEEANGNIIPDASFKLLHYEDPRIIQLKQTDVRAEILKIIFFFEKWI